ncbi:universal stress protein, partial [Clavibacter michiganensis]|uniref:universal stress protein n=1 Tax=Clavibacter michiganensis TaxID=28447 RepID=UPI00292D8070
MHRSSAAPLTTVLGPHRPKGQTDLSYRLDAEAAVATVAAVFDGWGPTIPHDVRSGSPATEITPAPEDLSAGPTSTAAGRRGLTATLLLWSSASRVPHSAPVPVRVCRPTVRGWRGG